MILENRRHVVDINKKNRKKKSKYMAVLNSEDDELKVTLKFESVEDGVIENIIDPEVDYYDVSITPIKMPQPQE